MSPIIIFSISTFSLTAVTILAAVKCRSLGYIMILSSMISNCWLIYLSVRNHNKIAPVFSAFIILVLFIISLFILLNPETSINQEKNH